MFLFHSLHRTGQKEHKSGEMNLNIYSSAELTALPFGMRHTAGEALSKLQFEHVSMDTQNLYKTMSS